MENLQEINLNDYIWVSLTEYGRSYLRDNPMILDCVKHCDKKVIEGKEYIQIQHHSFISYFGNALWMTQPAPVISKAFIEK